MRWVGMHPSPRKCLARIRPFLAAAALIAVTNPILTPFASAEENLRQNLAGYRIVDSAIPESLTGRPGDAVRGEQIVRDVSNATCLICHAISIAGERDPGNIGPPLDGVGLRYSAGELRLRLVDPKYLNAETIMPSYFQASGLYRVDPDFENRPIYSAQDIEDVVAYLQTLL